MIEHMWSRGMCLILDSGFCVLKGLIELAKKGVFAAGVIKKRRYWPKHIDGESIDAHCDGKSVCEYDCLPGLWDTIPFNIFRMKEPKYVMKIMSTFGSLLVDEYGKQRKRKYKDASNNDVDTTFRYTMPFANHFKYRHAVDDHNHLRHQIPSLEGTWVTHYWPCRVFAFFLAITKINAFYASRFFIGTKTPP